MSNAREAIFSKIKATEQSRGRADTSAATQRLQTPPSQLVPQIGTSVGTAARDMFVTKAMELGCTLADCADMAAVPGKVASYLDEQDATRTVTLPASDLLSQLGWIEAGLTVSADTDRAALDGQTSVTRARAGIAETGAVAVASATDYPVSIGLLPDRHIIVLKTSEIVGGYEQVWQNARQAKDNQGMSRALILVGGPSRTADIEATLVMGAHGPRAVHIILVDDTGAGAAEDTGPSVQ